MATSVRQSVHATGIVLAMADRKPLTDRCSLCIDI